VLLPKPLSTSAAATTFSANRLPPCGKMAVTPVWISPLFSVQWPTRTPGTSAMLLRSPGVSEPQARPRSRARMGYRRDGAPNAFGSRRHIEVAYAKRFQRVQHDEHHCRQRADASRLARALHAERIAVRAAVHEACGRQYHLLYQHLADALRHAAMDLSRQGQWVD